MRERLVVRAKALAPWIITVVLLVILYFKFDFKEAVERIKGANLYLFLPVAIIANVYLLFINSYVYYKVVNWFGGPIKYKDVLSIRGASYLLTSVNAGAGQGGMMYLLSKRGNIELKKVVGASLFVPVVDLMFVASALLIPLVANLAVGGIIPDPQKYTLYIVLLVMWTLVFLHFLFWRVSPESFGRRLKDWEWVRPYRDAKLVTYLKLLGVRCCQHIPGILAFWLGLMAFRGYVGFPTFVARFFPALIIQAMPISVAQTGTAQAGWILMFGDIVNHETLIAFTLSWNVLYFLSRVAIGIVFFRGEVKKFMQTEGKKPDRVNAGGET